MKMKLKLNKKLVPVLLTFALAAVGTEYTITAADRQETEYAETNRQTDEQREQLTDTAVDDQSEKQSEQQREEQPDTGSEKQSESQTQDLTETPGEQQVQIQPEQQSENMTGPEASENPDTAKETLPEQKEIYELLLCKGALEVQITRKDGGSFPEGVKGEMFFPEETEEVPGTNASENLIRELICSVRVTDKDGSDLPETDYLLEFHIRDEAFFQDIGAPSVICEIIHYMEAPDFKQDTEMELKGVLVDPQNAWVAVNVSVKSFGWFSFRLNQSKADESEEEQLMIEEWENSVDLMNAALNQIEGSPITEAGSGYTLVNWNDRTYSGLYNPVRKHANTEMSMWNNAGGSVLEKVISSEGVRYFLPADDSAKGKFGFRFSNVAYNRDAKCSIDLLITITDYKNYGYDSDGNKVSNIYPMIGMNNNLKAYFHTSLPDIELKYDFVQSGTNTPVAGNYRFKWLDIDGYQKFGFCIQNGNLDQKYALSDAIINVDTRTVFNKSFYCLNGVGVSGMNDPRQSVVFELSNSTGFYLLLRQRASGKVGDFTEKTIKANYNDCKAGTVQNNYAVLDWNGEAYGPDEITAPVKYVSADCLTLLKENTLPALDTPWFYSVMHFVPEETDSYYYSCYTFADTLPQGVDYGGGCRVIRMEDGTDVTGWFHCSADNDVIQMAADPSVLGVPDFYGSNYRFDILVVLDPEEITPAYQKNKTFYTVQNTAQIAAQHLTDPQPVTLSSDTVTTTVAADRIPQPAPLKALDGEPGRTEKYYENKNEAVCFSIYQQIPNEPSSWMPSEIRMADTLEAALDFEGCRVYLKTGQSESYNEMTDWSIQQNGQDILAVHAFENSMLNGMLRWDIYCRLKPDADLSVCSQILDQQTWAVLSNTAKVTLDWGRGDPGELELPTNTVTVFYPVPEVSVVLRKTSRDTGEIIKNAEFTVFEWDGTEYSTETGKLSFNEKTGNYEIRNLTENKKNSGKYKIVETLVPEGYFGKWEQEIQIPEGERKELSLSAENSMTRGRIRIIKKSSRLEEGLEGGVYEIRANKDIISPQGNVLISAGKVVETVVTGKDGSVTSGQLFPGEYLITETKAPLGYALDAEPQILQIPAGSQETPEATIEAVFKNDRLYADILLTKTIDASELTMAHGIPCFVFRITGTDVLGVSHTYYEMVDFSGLQEGESGELSRTAACHVLAGEYTVSEEKTMRYKLEKIYSIQNGSLSEDGKAVHFDLTEGGEASAAFFNRKINQEEESHSDFVRNIVAE